MISYWPSYRSEVSCTGGRPEANTADLGRRLIHRINYIMYFRFENFREDFIFAKLLVKFHEKKPSRKGEITLSFTNGGKILNLQSIGLKGKSVDLCHTDFIST